MTPRRARSRQSGVGHIRLALLVLAVAISVAASGCSAVHRVASGRPDEPAASSSQRPTESAASITMIPPNGTTSFAPDGPVTVSVQRGRLQTVDLLGPDGSVIAGQLGPTGDVWTATGYLQLATPYTLRATAVDPDGLALTATSTFTTMAAPADPVRVRVSPLDTETVGVGMPIVLYFTRPVIDRAAVEKRLSVTSTPPVVGGWFWVNSAELHWRPQQYWPVGTAVSVSIPLNGANTGDGVYGDQNRVISFTISDRAMEAVVDAAAYTMTVKQDGAVLKTLPITSGKAGWETRNGVKVILEKWPTKEMDAATLGIDPSDPDYYDLTVQYALRMTSSGEFIHAAPWSQGSQGSANVSHGCVGLAPADAKWLFDLTTRGDVVTVQNSPRPLEQGNGYTDWNYTWPEWLAGSALAAAAPTPTG